MMTTVGLVNASITSHNYHFLFMVRTLKMYPLNGFQGHNTELVTTVTTLYADLRTSTHLRNQAVCTL